MPTDNPTTQDDPLLFTFQLLEGKHLDTDWTKPEVNGGRPDRTFTVGEYVLSKADLATRYGETRFKRLPHVPPMKASEVATRTAPTDGPVPAFSQASPPTQQPGDRTLHPEEVARKDELRQKLLGMSESQMKKYAADLEVSETVYKNVHGKEKVADAIVNAVYA